MRNDEEKEKASKNLQSLMMINIEQLKWNKNLDKRERIMETKLASVDLIVQRRNNRSVSMK